MQAELGQIEMETIDKCLNDIDKLLRVLSDMIDNCQFVKTMMYLASSDQPNPPRRTTLYSPPTFLAFVTYSFLLLFLIMMAFIKFGYRPRFLFMSCVRIFFPTTIYCIIY